MALDRGAAAAQGTAASRGPDFFRYFCKLTLVSTC